MVAKKSGTPTASATDKTHAVLDESSREQAALPELAAILRAQFGLFLIELGRRGRIPCDEVNVFALFDVRHIQPRFDGKRVAVGEAQRGFCREKAEAALLVSMPPDGASLRKETSTPLASLSLPF